MDIEGSVLITGCSSGIGRAAAIGLAAKGYDVIASTRTMEQADDLAHMGLRAVVMRMDDPMSIAQGWSEALTMAGPKGIFGLFANAGYGLPGALEDITWPAMEAQFRTNVFGTHELVRLAASSMRKRGSGRIVVCSSVLGLVGMRYRGAYVGTKFALEGLSDVWRLELHGSNIHMCLLEPGPVLTRFRANGYRVFMRDVWREGSFHRAAYAALEKKLQEEGAVVPFTADAAGCVPLLEHALTARRPRARYRWTPQTTVFSILKRLLPARWLDAVARRG